MGTTAPYLTDSVGEDSFPLRSRSGGQRLARSNRLGEVLGPEHADFMMQHLSTEPGDQLATKSDIVRLEGRIDELAKSVRDHQRTYLVAMVGAVTAQTAIIGLIVGLVR